MIAVLVGTRPEIIKMAVVIQELIRIKLPFIFIHSNQHYSLNMGKDLFCDLNIPKPNYSLRVGSGSHAVQTGRIIEKVEKLCLKIKPKIMVVHGDTNTTLSGALAAKKLNIKVAHVEAGLRSFDNSMPEEINRILTDRISDILFAPTIIAKQNLLNEGISNKNIIITGNTITDVVQKYLPLSKKNLILKQLALDENEYILLTLHRTENVDTKEKLTLLFKLLEYISSKINKKMIFPIHPRTEKNIAKFNVRIPKQITTIKPVSFTNMLSLINNAGLILTDSGGIQEEAYLLKKPLITLRDTTERPETLSANFLITNDFFQVDKALKAYKNGEVFWSNKLGNGNASQLIVQTIKKLLL
jgi:UDP-N-acetylglucosamine 2-epimerase (non-hydrolysing)